jgi:Flp pilus assembly protein CpaB
VFRRKLPTSSLVFLSLSLVAGLLAVMLMRGYARKLQTTRPDVGQPVNVVVTTRAIARGATVTPDMVRAHQMPSAFVPPGAVQTPGDVLGHVLSADVAAGEVLTRTRLAGTESGPVAALVPPGLRAFPIPSNLLAGAIRTGDRVDVLAAFGGGRPHVETVATDVEVSQVLTVPDAGALAGVDTPSGPSLVLLVDTDTAEQLAFAVTFAKLAVTIEPPGGNDFFTTSGGSRG